MDARLRPEGASAPMAISLAGYRRYLAQRAATWERMALSRARQVAGDAEFGARVLRAIERFVYSREADAALAVQMQEMRQRMEPQGKRRARIDIKRRARAASWISSLWRRVLVLKWGYRDRSLRVGSTRRALQLLVERGLFRLGAGAAFSSTRTNICGPWKRACGSPATKPATPYRPAGSWRY